MKIVPRMKRAGVARIVALSFAALVGSGQAAFAASTSDIAMLKGPDRERTLLAGAQKEGKVVLYSAMIVNQALRPLVEGFQKEYPGVAAEFWRSESGDIVNKVLAETRARALQADVVEGANVVPAFLSAKVLEPFYSTAFAELDGDLTDRNGFWAATRLNYFGLAFNTKSIAKNDVPKTYEAMLDPKYRGRFAWAAEGETGTAMMFITTVRRIFGEDKAVPYLERLSQQKVVNATGSARSIVDRVVQGEYPMAIGMFAHHALISAEKGAPVDSRMMEPIPGNSSDIMFLKGAPHPHAALLLIDFILSRKGQGLLREAQYFPAHPAVLPQDSLRRILPSQLGMKQVFLSAETAFAYRSRSIELQKKYFE